MAPIKVSSRFSQVLSDLEVRHYKSHGVVLMAHNLYADATPSRVRLSQVDTAEERDALEEPLVKYNTADWAVPSNMDLADDSLFVEPIAPIIVPPKYKSSDYCTYKPPAL